MNKLKRYIVPGAVMLIGLGFFVYGITNGEAATVLKKAVAICMECIGLG